MITTKALASEMDASIHHAIDAHSNYPKSEDDTIRFWDRTTPYAVHPIWCGMTILTETKLPEEIRFKGYQALLWHDTLEDTLLPLPEYANKKVAQLVAEMSFQSFKDEQEKIGACRDIVKLLKLYDKVSILLDASWMKPEKWNHLVDYTLNLSQFVLDNYGDLNIVRIAQAICQYR